MWWEHVFPRLFAPALLIGSGHARWIPRFFQELHCWSTPPWCFLILRCLRCSLEPRNFEGWQRQRKRCDFAPIFLADFGQRWWHTELQMDLELRFLRRLDTWVHRGGFKWVTCLQDFLEQLNIKPSQFAFHLMRIDMNWQLMTIYRTLMEEWLAGTGIADTIWVHWVFCLQEAPTAAASVTKLFPILKDVLAIFGLIDPWKRNWKWTWFTWKSNQLVERFHRFSGWSNIMPIWTTMSDSLLRMPAARRCPRGCQNLEVERWTCRMQLGRNWKCQKNMRENASCYHLPLFFWLKWSTWRFPHSILGASKLAVVCMMLQLPFALEGPSCYTLVVWLNFSTPAQRRR